VTVLLGAMVGLVLWRALPFLGPVPPSGLYSSDSAVPVLMCNLATGAPVDWLFWGQDRFGSWPFLLARAVGALVDRAWTPHGLHVVRTLWMVVALVPWLGLAGRSGLVAAAGLLLLPRVNPLLQRVLVDLGTVDGWQLPAILCAWWGIRRAAEGGRPWPWLTLASVSGALATWTSLVSAPLLLVLALVEGRGRGLGAIWRSALVLPSLFGLLVEGVVRTSWHRAVRARGWRDVRTPASLDVGHLLENVGRMAGTAWEWGAVPWLAVALLGALTALGSRRWRDSPEARTMVGAAAASFTALLVVVSVRHVRDNAYHPRYLGIALALAVLGTAVLLGVAVRAGAARLALRRPSLVVGAVGLGAVALLAPRATPDPREVVLRPAAEEIGLRYPGAVLTLGYWRTYALAALLRPGAVIPVPREGEWNRRPDWVAELRSGRPVLVGRPDRPGDAAPPALVERGAALVLVQPDVLILPPFPGESLGERVSLYRLAPGGG
jgi:hypothetical protein